MLIVVEDEFLLGQIKKISELKKVTEVEALEMCIKVGIGVIGRRYGLVTYNNSGNKDKGGVWEDGTSLAARL